MYSIKKLIYLLVLLLAMISCSEEEQVVPVEKGDLKQFQGLINDKVGNVPVVIYANEEQGILTVFDRTVRNEELSFELSPGAFPNNLIDNHGMLWDVFGNGVSEGNNDEILSQVDHIVGYWFFFPSFYKDIELYSGKRISSGTPQISDEEWLISTADILFGSFRDGIRSIDNPQFIKLGGKEIVDNSFYSTLERDELFTLVDHKGSFKAYPHRILEYHEIVNDISEELCLTISYCPLTGTSRAWASKVNNKITEFGVSGLLYNNNLILYDRETESHWSQILNLSVNGSTMGQGVANKQVLELKYSELSKLDGDIFLLDPSSGLLSSYNSSSYEDYKSNDHVFFPLSNVDNSIPSKERVLGVTVDGKTKVYRFSDFQ
jgi:hypothetical protein